MGVRLFRWFVPDGDAANKWRRRREPAFRMIRNRRQAVEFVQRTEMGEKSHLVMLALGFLSTAFAWRIGWTFSVAELSSPSMPADGAIAQLDLRQVIVCQLRR